MVAENVESSKRLVSRQARQAGHKLGKWKQYDVKNPFLSNSCTKCGDSASIGLSDGSIHYGTYFKERCNGGDRDAESFVKLGQQTVAAKASYFCHELGAWGGKPRATVVKSKCTACGKEATVKLSNGSIQYGRGFQRLCSAVATAPTTKGQC